MTDLDAEILVSAQGLSRRFGPHQAVQGLNLELRRGEVLGLLGPNGAGKTTSLRMLTGILAPHSGQVRIGGIDMARAPERARALLGYLPEQPPLHPELGVREYLRFCARLHGLTAAQADEAVGRAIAACGLEDVSRQTIGSLSKGYQQRTGIAQAIVHRPPLIILDEPTVGLDPNQMRQIRALIMNLAQDHAIILSSHILSEVQAVCQRVLILAGGRTVHDGPLRPQDRPGAGFKLLVGLRQPPALEALAGFSGVQEVDELDGGQFRLDIAAGHDPRESLVLQAAALGWGLYEMHQERPELEQIFAELTA